MARQTKLEVFKQHIRDTNNIDKVREIEADRSNLTEEEFREKYEFTKSSGLQILYEFLPEEYQPRQKKEIEEERNAKKMSRLDSLNELLIKDQSKKPVSFRFGAETLKALDNAKAQYPNLSLNQIVEITLQERFL